MEIIVVILVVGLVLVVQVSLIRWVLRIDEIVDLLDKVVANTMPRVACDCCGKAFTSDKLKTTSSGQSLCPECYSAMSAKYHQQKKESQVLNKLVKRTQKNKSYKERLMGPDRKG